MLEAVITMKSDRKKASVQAATCRAKSCSDTSHSWTVIRNTFEVRTPPHLLSTMMGNFDAKFLLANASADAQH